MRSPEQLKRHAEAELNRRRQNGPPGKKWKEVHRPKSCDDCRDGLRWCNRCKAHLPIDRFLQSHSWCRACLKEYRDARYGPDSLMRKNTLQKGITIQEFVDTLAAQGNACAVCRSEDPGDQGQWHIDHDHSCCPESRACGKCFRGLLCAVCNRGLGHFHDDPELLRRAIEYLEK